MFSHVVTVDSVGHCVSVQLGDPRSLPGEQTRGKPVYRVLDEQHVVPAGNVLFQTPESWQGAVWKQFTEDNG